jgi:hypothetical protein
MVQLIEFESSLECKGQSAKQHLNGKIKKVVKKERIACEAEGDIGERRPNAGK